MQMFRGWKAGGDICKKERKNASSRYKLTGAMQAMCQEGRMAVRGADAGDS